MFQECFLYISLSFFPSFFAFSCFSLIFISLSFTLSFFYQFSFSLHLCQFSLYFSSFFLSFYFIFLFYSFNVSPSFVSLIDLLFTALTLFVLLYFHHSVYLSLSLCIFLPFFLPFFFLLVHFSFLLLAILLTLYFLILSALQLNFLSSFSAIIETSVNITKKIME
ncbi:unnamed protein product [Acanthosepion pharaonis]|uniref:Uncharacterized protein n=1 Tax=Acanthosepion pharaonis TaxID=158019 RepID=A0A812BXQ3_ACAPH|nr:unnamed protein product [Sepia pharaonis]